MAAVFFETMCFVRRPIDHVRRRRIAANCVARASHVTIDKRDGYATFKSAWLPGIGDLLRDCGELLEVRRPTDDGGGKSNITMRRVRSKEDVLRNLLVDDDRKRHPHLLDFALSDIILHSAVAYLQTVPRLNRVDLLYSTGREKTSEPIASQQFHLDPEGLRQLKLFVNVHHVGADDGPLMFVPAEKSQSIARLVRRERLAAGVPDGLRYTDAELLRHCAESEIRSLIGPPGTAVLLDTSRCLHAGSRLAPGRTRIVYYAQYCTTIERGDRLGDERFNADGLRRLATQR